MRCAYRHLLQNAAGLGIRSAPAVILGHSAGGQLALCLAAHEESVQNCVSLAGVLDLRRAWQLHLSNDAVVEYLGGTPEQVPEHYREASPMELTIATARQVIVHGLADERIDVIARIHGGGVSGQADAVVSGGADGTVRVWALPS